MNSFEPDILRARINLETASVPWKELQRFFANGSLILVDKSLDLVDVAQAVAEDNTRQIKSLMDEGLIGSPEDDQARAWHEQQSILWAVVIKPWVLIQDRDATG